MTLSHISGSVLLCQYWPKAINKFYGKISVTLVSI